MFKNATIKLTFWYLTIIFFINIGFSVIVYSIGSYQIDHGLHSQIRRLEQQYPIFQKNDLIKSNLDIDSSKHQLLLKLFIYNLSILVLSGFASYFLAKRTLQPIEDSHIQQKRFTSDVSHELRTPLTAIKMESEVALLNPKSTTKELKKTISSNVEEVEKLEKIINNLLKLSKLEADDIRSSFTKLSSKTMTAKAIEKVSVLAKNKSIDITNESKNFDIYGDEESVTQLITIILENAIKYSANNKLIEITSINNKDTNLLIIKDHGIGIGKDDLNNIFSRFYKADKSRNNKGYGLGLSIAKMIADIHAVNIVVTSSEGKGTTVDLVFPRNDL